MTWNHNHYPEELNEAYRLAQATSTLLVVRVRDQEVRTKAETVKMHCTCVVAAKSKTDSDSGMGAALTSFFSVNARIGELIRELDVDFETS
jgi:hypothetical protein